MCLKLLKPILLIPILVIILSCNLLNPDVEDNQTTSNTVQGTWIEVVETPLEIIKFSGQNVVVYSYDPVDSVIDTASGTFVINSSSNRIVISFGSGEIDTVPYSLVNNELIVTDEFSNEKKYNHWSGEIPLLTWKEKETTIFSLTSGIYENGLPSGAWRSNMEGKTEIVMIWSDTIKIFNFISSADSLNVNIVTYAVNAEKTAFIINNEDGSPADVIPYTYYNGVLFITEPDDSEQLQYTAYDQKQLPWSFSKIGYDSDEDKKSIDGKWISSNQTFIVAIYNDTFENISYDPVDSVIERHVNSYYFNQANDTIILEISSTGKQYVGFHYDGDNQLTLNLSGGETIVLNRHSGSLILEWWKEKVIVTNPLIGTWALAGDTPSEILLISGSKIIGYSYSSENLSIDTSYYDYSRNTERDSITLHWSDLSMAFEYYFTNDTLILEDDDYIYTYFPYSGQIPHHSWTTGSSLNSRAKLNDRLLVQ